MINPTSAANTPIAPDRHDVTPRQIARHAYHNGAARAAIQAAKEAATDLIHAHALQTQIRPETYEQIRTAAQQLRRLLEAADQEATLALDDLLNAL